MLSQGASAQNSNQLAAIPDNLSDLSLEDLLNIQVTSVSRVAEDLSGAPASIQVITSDDIQRSGARNLPELLRLATGLQVAQINGRSWAITARGFNGALADKLEVRLDGRTLYTPLFSGVIWEAQDPPLETLDRIEIIRGPGASLWGANAVNGVINIVSKSAEDTQGSSLYSQAGNELSHQAYARHGADLGAYGHWRIYAQTREMKATSDVAADVWRDDLSISSAGLRGDIALNTRDDLFLSMNAQDARMGSASSTPGSDEAIRGIDAIARWTRVHSSSADYQLQLSVDRSWRDIPGLFGEKRTQADLDFRHHWQLGAHDLVWGAGYRISSDQIYNTATTVFDPAERDLNTINVFLQDRVTLSDSLTLTVGSKFEHNDYTGPEVQPTLRLAWQAGEHDNLWMAASKATRSPNRVDRDYFINPPPSGGLTIVGNTDFESEQALVGEFGWRHRFNQSFSIDLATFYAEYEKLRGLRSASTVDPSVFAVSNEGAGESYGAELTAIWLPRDNWRIWFGYSYLNVDFAAVPGSTDFSIAGANELDPEHQVKIRSSWDISSRWRLNGMWRYFSRLADNQTPAYNELDLNLSYQLSKAFKLQVAGRNLLNAEHLEFNDGNSRQAQREIYAGIRWDLK